MTEPTTDGAWKLLLTTLLADADLTGLLADATSIFFGLPTSTKPFPFCYFSNYAANSTGSFSSRGLYRPQGDLVVIDDSVHTADKVFSVLEEKFSIPEKRPTVIQNSDFRWDLLQWESCRHLPGLVDPFESGVWAKASAIPFRGRFKRRTT